MRRFNLCVKKTYGEGPNVKNYWPNVGTMVYFPATQGKNEGYKMELNMFPGTQFYVFENKPKEQVAAQPTAVEYPTETINPEDIPY